MQININDTKVEFISIRLVFSQKEIKNLFANKNNETVSETLMSPKYSKFDIEISRNYPDSLNKGLGEFLLELKERNDLFYLKFLNKYGDKTYCKFKINTHKDKKGIYCYVVENKIMYIGRSHDPFGKRISHGYGNISPKNCYLDGQSTNCHLNSLITNYMDEIELFVLELDDDLEIDRLERELIKAKKPEWNILL